MTIRTSDIDGVDMVILPPVRDLGDGFTVRRALPSAHRRMVGPFIFFDQMGPAAFTGDEGLDVRPHPHIGLATITYLLEGEIMHRDSVGSVQPIRPGEVNWMTAGSGIVHSERTPDALRPTGSRLAGLQTWVALPTAHEETDPSFAHHKADTIPAIEDAGTKLTLIVGTSDGLKSPVKTFSDMVYADIVLAPGARYQLKGEHVERAVYVVSGEVEVVGQSGSFAANELVVFKPDAEIVLRSTAGARLMLIGGEPFPEKRNIYWNFVSSSQDRIEQAKADWRGQRFPKVPAESEFIPLPEDPKPVRYP
ncbi:pirin family protein [Sphingomonas montanisoli]|uniref:Pirin family protein n=1 Tax=Sphingomonas montanisoli TaxID=2606412 RepID=A0A5D9C2R4_9SPHN|nr:pirin family protein [Sphingomonas montanisoli]TZG26024.1 pirin family protein [Sphingomonas montanisoli]